MLLCTPASRIWVPGFESQLLIPYSFVCVPWKTAGDGSSTWVPVCHVGNPELSSQLLKLAWSSPGFCKHLGNQPSDGRSVSVSFSSHSLLSFFLPSPIPPASQSFKNCTTLLHYKWVAYGKVITLIKVKFYSISNYFCIFIWILI